LQAQDTIRNQHRFSCAATSNDFYRNPETHLGEQMLHQKILEESCETVSLNELQTVPDVNDATSTVHKVHYCSLRELQIVPDEDDGDSVATHEIGHINSELDELDSDDCADDCADAFISSTTLACAKEDGECSRANERVRCILTLMAVVKNY
jgi:hypothetical protein